MPKADFPRTSPLGEEFNPFDTGVQAKLNRGLMIAYRFAALEEGLTSLLARPIPRESPVTEDRFIAIIGMSNAIGLNRFTYEWQEAKLKANFTGYELDPDGRKWNDEGNTRARNLVEQLNTNTVAVHGHEVGAGAVADVIVLPIPDGTPTELTFETASDNTRRYFFREPNALGVTCVAAASQPAENRFGILQ